MDFLFSKGNVKTKAMKIIKRFYSIKIRLISDIHLEKRKSFHVQPFTINKNVTTVCVLAGDIGYPSMTNYRDFLKDTKSKFNHVLVTLGNHEYVDDNPEAAMSDICKETGCVLLNRNTIKIHNYVFFGCVLWSFIPLKNKPIPIVFKHNEKHYRDLRWIKSVLEKCKDKDIKGIIGVTHYAPSFKMIHPRFKNKTNHHRFASDIEYIFTPQIKAWFSGHTHGNMKIKIGNMDCISNCVGNYMDEQETGFNSNFEYELPIV